MNHPIHILRYRQGEEQALLEVHYSATHLVAIHDYSAEQIKAWAPPDPDLSEWERRIRSINPFVAKLGGKIVGYADVQPNGYIDHFFVSGLHPRQGIGASLMRRIIQEATSLDLGELTSDVSKTAQPFFEKFGFEIVEQRYPKRRGVIIPNALMRRRGGQA